MTYTASDHIFVIVAYGESPYLEDCLRSLESQTVSSSIVIATSTPTASLNRLANDHKISLFVNAQGGGIGADWNYALKIAEKPLVTLAHQDDVYSPHYVEWMLAVVNDSSRPLLYFTNYTEIGQNGQILSRSRTRPKEILLFPLRVKRFRGWRPIKHRVLSFGNPICCPSVTYVLSNLTLPLFTTELRSNLDWTAWEEISRLRGDFLYDTRIGMSHRIHESSETSACIIDDTRTKEDLVLLSKFWPLPIAKAINAVYKKAQH